MRSTICAIAVVILGFASGLSASSQATDTGRDADSYQTGYCPQTHPLEIIPQNKYWLEGTIGFATVRMYLDRGGSGVVGLFYRSADDWTPTLLGGEWIDGNINLSDRTESQSATGRLQGHLREDSLVGTWTLGAGNLTEPIQLKVIPEPKCDGNGAWKRFDSSKWPISFSYPASWRVVEEGSTIRLVCPNPAEIAYGQDITIHEGKGKPGGPTAVMQCGGAWRYGYGASCACGHSESGNCQAAKVTHRNGATILDTSEHEWRVYCFEGGYVGQGEGEDRVVLLSNRWIEVIGTGQPAHLIDRLIATVRINTDRAGKPRSAVYSSR